MMALAMGVGVKGAKFSPFTFPQRLRTWDLEGLRVLPGRLINLLQGELVRSFNRHLDIIVSREIVVSRWDNLRALHNRPFLNLYGLSTKDFPWRQAIHINVWVCLVKNCSFSQQVGWDRTQHQLLLMPTPPNITNISSTLLEKRVAMSCT